MVDTHAHLDLCEVPADELVGRAREAGVRRILTVGTDQDSNQEAVAAAETHEAVFASVGRHPNAARGFDDRAAEEIEALAAHERAVAIGETGLDYYRDGAPRADQRRAFSAQIAIARRVGLPLVIHVRDGDASEAAVADTFAILAAEAESVAVVLHCYSAGPQRVSEAAERGWYCSFAGNLTYPKADRLREAARLVPADLLLAETDSPFLSPQSARGKPNHPANVVEVASRLAAERGVDYSDLESQLEANGSRVFRW